MRPIEWLLNITSSTSGFEKLLNDSGGLSSAAYQLARARCMTRDLATSVPTRMEVRAAARQLAGHGGIEQVPTSAQLARECELLGLPVM